MTRPQRGIINFAMESALDACSYLYSGKLCEKTYTSNINGN